MDTYGILLNENNIKLNRMWFHQMLVLHGMQVIYRAPISGRTWTTYGEIDMNYQTPEVVGCIFNDHPDQRTMKKLGWVAELNTEACIIQVPYDLHDLQVGAIFIIPGGIDNSEGRIFKVSKMSSIMLYPASITCELVPEYESTYAPNQSTDFESNSYNLLNQDDED